MLTVARSEVPASWWDSVGQLFSALCLAHCLVLPVVLGLLPAAAAEFLEGEGVHHGLIGFVVVSAGAAFVPGYRRHRSAPVMGLAAAALGLLGAAAFLVPEGAESLETGFTLAGGVLMAVAHARNRTLCRRASPGRMAPLAPLDGPARVR